MATIARTSLFDKKASISHARLLLKYRAYLRLYRSADLDGVDRAAEYVERLAALMGRLGLECVYTVVNREPRAPNDKMRPARFERATSASAGQRSIP